MPRPLCVAQKCQLEHPLENVMTAAGCVHCAALQTSAGQRGPSPMRVPGGAVPVQHNWADWPVADCRLRRNVAQLGALMMNYERLYFTKFLPTHLVTESDRYTEGYRFRLPIEFTEMPFLLHGLLVPAPDAQAPNHPTDDCCLLG